MPHRLSRPTEVGTGRVECHTLRDGYSMHVRRWGSESGRVLFVFLHGGMSHSGWAAPLAEPLLAHHGVSFAAIDRRGAGLNVASRGDFVSTEVCLDDFAEIIERLKPGFEQLVVLGWCYGAMQAAALAARRPDLADGLVLQAPSFSTRANDDRFRAEAWQRMQKRGLLEENMIAQPVVPIPLRGCHFTSDPEWIEFVDNDPIRTLNVSPREWLAHFDWRPAVHDSDLPQLVLLAQADALLDNLEIRRALDEAGSNAPIEAFDTAHAIHFEMPVELARTLAEFAERIRAR